MQKAIEKFKFIRNQFPPPHHTAYSQGRDFTFMKAIEELESLLPEEKQMIIDAYERGDKYKFEIPGEQYFKETYQ